MKTDATYLRGARDKYGFIHLLPDPTAVSNANLIAEARKLVARGLQDGLLSVRPMSETEQKFVDHAEKVLQQHEVRRKTHKKTGRKTNSTRKAGRKKGWVRQYIVDFAGRNETFSPDDLCPPLDGRKARMMCSYLRTLRGGEVIEVVEPTIWRGAYSVPAIYRLSRGTKSDAGPLPSSGAQKAPREGTRPGNHLNHARDQHVLRT